MKSRDYDVDAAMERMDQLKLKYGARQWGDLWDIPQARQELTTLLKPFMQLKSK